MAAMNILDIVEIPDQGIIMPDGCRLSARIWLPQNAHSASVPAILNSYPTESAMAQWREML